MRSSLDLRTVFSKYSPLFFRRAVLSVAVFVFSFAIFAPSVSEAVIFLPLFNINITKQSVGGDGSFDFHYVVQDTYFNKIDSSGNFQIGTNQGAGSYLLSDWAPSYGGTVTITENPIPGWSNTGVFCVSGNPEFLPTYITNGVTVNADTRYSVNCTFTNTKTEDKPDPVIIIPGILGSAEKNGVWVIDPILHTYDNLINTLKENGYTEGKDLFVFPYNWENSNAETALMFSEKINEVKDICQCSKVNLVAHSMGGLVARQYIQSENYQNDVNKLIFLGTPHLGAPEAYIIWDGGTVAPDDLTFKVVKQMLQSEAMENHYETMFDYIRNRPVTSIQELLPVYDYIVDKKTGIMRSYPNNYPQNTFLENLDNNVSVLLNSGVDVTNIVGNTGTSTISSYIVVPQPRLTAPLWEHGYPDFFSSFFDFIGIKKDLGDATVPLSSAGFITSNLNIINSKHSELPTNAEGLVYKELTGKDATTLVNDKKTPDFGLIFIKILSPADIQVVAPDGSIVGKDFLTGQEVNQIPGAFYSGFETDDEYVTIPDPLPGDYLVKTVGTGSGSYTIATGLISNTGSNEKDVVGTTEPGFVANVQIGVFDDGTLNVLPPDVQAVTPDSVIADIQLAYDNGWLKDKKTKEKLIKEIKDMIKVEKKIEKLKAKVRGKNIEKKVERLETRLETRVDKVLARTLINELKLYNKGKILTDEGFNLIKNDIELLILVY